MTDSPQDRLKETLARFHQIHNPQEQDTVNGDDRSVDSATQNAPRTTRASAKSPASDAAAEAAPPAPATYREPYEILFSAIREGDAAGIKAVMAKHHIPVNPPADSKYGFPESLLQRAVRAEQMPSVVAVLEIAKQGPDGKDDFTQWDTLLNSRRVSDGNTVMHDLAASMPADYKIPDNQAAWKPAALLEYLAANNADLLITNHDGKTAGDIAPNPAVQSFLKAEEQKIIAEDVAFETKWQASENARANTGPKLVRSHGRPVEETTNAQPRFAAAKDPMIDPEHRVALGHKVTEKLFLDAGVKSLMAKHGDNGGIVAGESALLSDALMHYADARLDEATGNAHARSNALAVAGHQRSEVKRIAGDNDGNALLKAADGVVTLALHDRDVGVISRRR